MMIGARLGCAMCACVVTYARVRCVPSGSLESGVTDFYLSLAVFGMTRVFFFFLRPPPRFW